MKTTDTDVNRCGDYTQITNEAYLDLTNFEEFNSTQKIKIHEPFINVPSTSAIEIAGNDDNNLHHRVSIDKLNEQSSMNLGACDDILMKILN